MSLRFIASAVIALTTLSDSAAAQSTHLAMQSGSDALETCAGLDDPRSRASTEGYVCLSWVSGAVQGASQTVSLQPEKPTYCSPRLQGTTGQYVAVFLRYLENHPEKLHLPAIYLFHQAMAEAFPCG